MRRRTILGTLGSLVGLAAPDSLSRVASAEIPEATVREATRETLPAFDDGNAQLYTSDGRYFAARDMAALAPLGELIAWLPYSPARFDCENFARIYRVLSALVLGVNAIGVVIDRDASHAYLIQVDADGEARLFEPQTDETVELGESESYVGEDVLVMF